MRTWGFLAATMFVIACGGGGGDAPDAEPGAPDAEVPDAEPMIIDELSFYAVSVAVVGLDGTLVLRNNGTDELTFTTSATMTFTNAIPQDEAYDVTVVSEPTSQHCTVTGGSGTITDDVIATVTCADKAWVLPASGDGINPFGGGVYEPHAGIDESGYAVVAYHADDGSTACGGDPCSRIFASERTDGAWNHPTSASQGFSPAGYGTATSDVAVADNGDAVVVYDLELGGSPSNALFRSDRRTGVWTHPTTTGAAFSFPVSWAQNAAPDLTPTGGGLILWTQVNGPGDVGDVAQIYASEYTGGAWADPADVDDNYGFDAYQAQQFGGGIADNGDLVVAWIQLDGAGGCGNPSTGCEQLYVSERRGVTETNPSDLDDHVSIGGTSAVSLELDVNGGGEAIVAWRQFDGTTACPGNVACNRIYAGTVASGARTFPSSLTDSVSLAASDAYTSRVAIDDAGNVIVVWTQPDGTATRLYRAERRGGVWTKPASLAAYVNAGDTNVDGFEVAMDNNGNAIIAWMQSDGTTACGGGSCVRVYLSEYRDGAWTDPDSLTEDAVSPAGVHANYLSLAMSDGGDAVVAWSSQTDDGTVTSIFIATYQ